MKTFKKVLALLLVAALAAGIAIVGTVAYFTHEDEDINTFTIGNVEVELVELQRDNQTNPNNLVDFQQNKPLMPVVGDISQKDSVYNIPNPSNYVDKIVYANNKGDSAAYMRIRVAIPTWENTTDTPDVSSTNNLHWNTPNSTTQDKLVSEKGLRLAESTYNLTYDLSKPITIDGQSYTVYTFTFQNAIPAGFSTKAVMVGLYLDSRVDYNPESGMYEDINGKEFYIRNNTVNVPVIVEGVQVDGFASAEAAFAAAEFPENPWAPAKTVEVEDAQSFLDALEALEEAEGDTVIDAKDAEVNMEYGLNSKRVPAGTTLTIKNATITGQNYGNGVDGTVIFENCVFTNDWAYSIHFDSGSGKVIFKDCELYGWCSFGSAIKSVEMYDCTIGGNSIYAMHRFYQDTVMVNCTIDARDADANDDFSDGISAVSGATVVLSNCNIIDADLEVGKDAKIVINGEVVLESIDGNNGFIKNEDR